MTPLIGLEFAKIAREAGLPPGVLNLVHGDKECVDALLTDARVQAISFVGSTPIAKIIHEIQSDTEEVADEMRKSSVVIGEGRDDVDTIASSLTHIRAAVGEAATRASWGRRSFGMAIFMLRLVPDDSVECGFPWERPAKVACQTPFAKGLVILSRQFKEIGPTRPSQPSVNGFVPA